MPRGNGRDLRMAHEWQVLFKAPDEIAADDLRVIEVKLDAHVRPLHLGDDVDRLLGAGEEIIRPVARIDRLDQERDVLLPRRVGGTHEVANEGHFRRRPLLRRYLAGEAVDLTAADGSDVVERLLEQRVKFPLVAGDGSDAELARCGLSRRGVDAEYGQAVPVELDLNRRRRVIIGDLQLDRAKSGGGRCGEPPDQRPLGEHISEIGGEAGHAGLTMRRDVIAGYEVIDTRRCPLTPGDRDCACSPTRPSTSPYCRATASGLR